MIATDRFVFLHLHKSGGSFVNACLLRFIPDARPIGYHLPRAFVPAPFGHLPLLGFVRSPWSYYVSWFFFQSRRPRPNILYQVLSDHGALGFADTVRNLLMLGDDDERLRRICAGLPAAYLNRGLNLPGFALLTIKGTGLGFYSFLERHIHGVDDRVFLGRMEDLRTDLPQLLDRVGQPVPSAMARFIRQEPKHNASEHDAYVDYYDDALKALVARRDGGLIERMGYRFGD